MVIDPTRIEEICKENNINTFLVTQEKIPSNVDPNMPYYIKGKLEKTRMENKSNFEKIWYLFSSPLINSEEYINIDNYIISLIRKKYHTHYHDDQEDFAFLMNQLISLFLLK